MARFVGRLHLTGESLDNYVNAALIDWKDCPARASSPVVWAVDHADSDITHLLRGVLADPVAEKLRSDNEITSKLRYMGSRIAATDEAENLGAARAAAQAATVVNLIAALQQDPAPAFIMTSSHGATGPISDNAEDRAVMLDALGLPVDQSGDLLRPAALLEKWQPAGAVWYAHACYSAWSDDKTQYGRLFDGGAVLDVLNAAARLGATVAPLPTALLGAEKPLRAFIGHVEPTFDWTLRNPKNNQPLAISLVNTLYPGLYQGDHAPVGMVFRPYFVEVGQLFSRGDYQKNLSENTLNPLQRERLRQSLLRTRLTALDRQSCVILGDPAVALPPM